MAHPHPTIDKNALFLIDGSGFLYRAYYGVRPLHTPDGTPVQAVYSFCRMIKKLIDRFNPECMALVWDSKGATIRHEMYPDYKAKRQAPPSDLFIQKELIKEFADAIGLLQVEKNGLEADDLIFSLAKEAAVRGQQAVIVSSDKDLAQALEEKIIIFDSFKDVFIDCSSFETENGYPVSKLIFYYALLGDSSDNIPGVKGIGKKGALDLVQQFDSLHDLYERIDQVPKERTRQLLLESRDDAFLSYKLFEAHQEKTSLTQSNLNFNPTNWSNAVEFFKKLNFKSLLTELGINQKELVTTGPTLSEIYTFKTITSLSELDELCIAIKKARIVAIDTELTGLDPLASKLVGISLCIQEGTSYYIPFGHVTHESQLDAQAVYEKLAPIFSDKTIAKIMHHAKYDCLALLASGYIVNGLAFDTLIAAHLVTPDWQSIGLKELSKHYFKEPMLSFKEVVSEKKLKDFSYVDLTTATNYAAADAHQTLRLYPILKKEIEEQLMSELFYTIELPLVDVLVQMQKKGIILDPSLLQKLDSQVSKELELIKTKIAALLDQEQLDINLNSPAQVKELLFETLQLPTVQTRKGGKGSTNVEALQELAHLHPVPGLILKYRELFKLKSTYIDALPRFIHPDTGHIHSNFSQTAVATGRLASSDPNLQNIPLDGSYEPPIRAAFKPEPGCVFISADYSQIELRVLAYLSQDPILLTAFAQEKDIHAQTAAALFSVAPEEVTSEQRQIGKRINFSILYGMTPYGLAHDLNIQFSVAKEYIKNYMNHYPGVKNWMHNVVEQTKRDGFVTTLWGRRRTIPGIYERNQTLYAEAERVAINTRAQGTAAEIVKIGMINVEKALKEKKLNAYIALQIHDELLINASKADAGTVEQLVKETLESVVNWNVPLRVTCRVGNDWNEVTK